MDKLPLAKRVQILSMLCEGSSMRFIARLVDCSINTLIEANEEPTKPRGAYKKRLAA